MHVSLAQTNSSFSSFPYQRSPAEHSPAPCSDPHSDAGNGRACGIDINYAVIRCRAIHIFRRSKAFHHSVQLILQDLTAVTKDGWLWRTAAHKPDPGGHLIRVPPKVMAITPISVILSTASAPAPEFPAACGFFCPRSAWLQRKRHQDNGLCHRLQPERFHIITGSPGSLFSQSGTARSAREASQHLSKDNTGYHVLTAQCRARVRPPYWRKSP